MLFLRGSYLDSLYTKAKHVSLILLQNIGQISVISHREPLDIKIGIGPKKMHIAIFARKKSLRLPLIQQHGQLQCFYIMVI